MLLDLTELLLLSGDRLTLLLLLLDTPELLLLDLLELLDLALADLDLLELLDLLLELLELLLFREELRLELLDRLLLRELSSSILSSSWSRFPPPSSSLSIFTLLVYNLKHDTSHWSSTLLTWLISILKESYFYLFRFSYHAKASITFRQIVVASSCCGISSKVGRCGPGARHQGHRGADRRLYPVTWVEVQTRAPGVDQP